MRPQSIAVSVQIGRAYRKAADQGNSEGQFQLGYMYERGWGVPKDEATAVALYRKAAGQGNDLARTRLQALLKKAPAAPPSSAPSTEPTSREAARASDPLVVAIQTLLATLGYDAGPADGFAGSKTAAAISEFQQSIGEKPDGRSSEALRASLQKALAERGPGSAPKQPDKPRDGSKGDTKLVSTGTGFFIAGDIIITNNHVVEGCKEIRRPRPRRSTA